MEETTLIKDFAVIMVTAGFVTLLFRRLNQPPVVGYLIAGLLIGPYTFSNPPVDDVHTIRLLADLGLVLLLFGLGLEFSWSKIRQIGFPALVIGTAEILTMIGLGYGLGRLLGWSATDSIFLGAAMHISSSAIISKTLRDMGRMNRLSARIIVGILVVEDFAAVIIISVLSGIETTGTADMGDIGALLWRLAIFIIASLMFGAFLVPRVIRFTHQFRSPEALLITCLGLCFAMALIGKSLGLSVAAGAFLMGALVGDTKYSKEVDEVVTPVRDMFAAIFFVAIGMLIDIFDIGNYIIPTIVVAAVFMTGKIISDSLAALASGYNFKTSLRVGMGMPVMGEFSLAISKMGMDRGVVTAPLYPVIALGTALTSIIGPYIMRLADAAGDFAERRSPRLLRAYISRLEEWPRALRSTSDSPGEDARKMQQSLRTIILHLLIVMAIIATGTFLLQMVHNQEIFSSFRMDFVGVFLALAVLMLCIPSFVILWRTVQRLVDEAAVFALRRRRGDRGWRYRALRIVIRDSIVIVLTVFVVLWFVPLISNLLQIGSFALVMVVVLLATALLLVLRFVWQIHAGLTRTFSQTLLGKDHTTGDDIREGPSVLRRVIRRLFPGDDSSDAPEESGEQVAGPDEKGDGPA